MALTLRWTETWDGSTLTWTETWGSDGTFVVGQVAPIALQGQLSLAGDLATTLGAGFAIEPLGPIALTGQLTAAGDISKRVPWEPLAPLQISLSGALGIAGDLVIAAPNPFTVAQVGSIDLVGSLGVAGDVSVTTAGQFALQAESPIALTGAMTLAGDVVIGLPVVFDIVQDSPIALAGVLGIAGDVQATQPVLVELVAAAPIALSGALGLAGDIDLRVPFDLVAGAPIALAGAIGLAGDLSIGSPFELTAAAPLALTGQLGVAGQVRATVPTTVPDVVGQQQASAEAALQSAGLVAVVTLVLSTSTPAGQVISQDPPAGTASIVGASVAIVVSQYDAPKVIGGTRNKNVRFKRLKKREDERREQLQDQERQAKPKASGLLAQLLQRAQGLEVPPAEPAPVSLEAPVVSPIEPIVSPEPDPVAPEPEPAPAAPVDFERAVLARLAELEAQVAQLKHELSLTLPVEPEPAADIRDPVAEALVAILPAVREPIPDLVRPAPRTMTDEERRAENLRRAKILARNLL